MLSLENLRIQLGLLLLILNYVIIQFSLYKLKLTYLTWKIRYQKNVYVIIHWASLTAWFFFFNFIQNVQYLINMWKIILFLKKK